MPVNRYKVLRALTIILFALLTLRLIIQAAITDLYLTPDSYTYVKFAEILIKGDSVYDYPQELVSVRTPGYPALIALSFALLGQNNTSILLMHFGLGVLLLLFVPTLFNPPIKPFLALFALAFVFNEVSAFIFSALTEWSSLCCLFVIFGCSLRYFQRATNLSLLVMTFFCALAILIRPALIPIATLPLIAALIIGRKVSLKQIAVVLLGLSPVVTYMAVNKAMTNKFTIAPFGGISLAGKVSSIGFALPQSTDTQDLLKLQDAMRSQGKLIANYNDSLKIEAAYNWNVWKVAEDLRKAEGWDLIYFNHLMYEYAFRVIKANPIEYFYRCLYQFFHQLSHVPLLHALLFAIALVVLVDWHRCRSNRALTLASLAMFYTHLVHMLLCAMTNVVFFRLFAVTYYPLFLAVLIIVLQFISERCSQPHIASQRTA